MKDLEQLKRKTCKIGIIFVLLMFLFTMISKTIYTLLLPRVALDEVRAGAIQTDTFYNGKVGLDELSIEKMKLVIKGSNEGQVTRCYVKENALVKKGDPLIEIENQVNSDKQMEVQQTKNEIDINLAAYQREKQNIEEKYNRQRKVLVDKKAKLQDFTDDYEIIELEKQIQQKEQEVTNNEALFEVGAIAQNDRDKSKDDLKLLNERIKILKEQHDMNLEEEIKQLEEQLEELENSKKEQDDKIVLDQNKLLAMEEKQGKKTIYSPIDGIIYELKIGVGASAFQGDELLIIIPQDLPMTLTFRMSQDAADKVEMGTKVTWTKEENNKTAEVIKKTYDSEKEDMIVTCKVDEAEVTDWITDCKTYKNVKLSMTYKSPIYQTVVPTSAISQGGQSAYVYTVEEIDTIFEKKFVVHECDVRIIEEGDEVTAVEGITEKTKIVVLTNKTLTDDGEVGLQ